jgi:hypothetical protein
MNQRKYEIMEQYIKGEITVHDMIEHIVKLEEQVKDLNEIAWGTKED